MLKHMREPGASLSVIPEGIKGELPQHLYGFGTSYSFDTCALVHIKCDR